MADNRTGSHRTGSSPSSRYNSGNNRRPGSYSERYNRPNPYTGYLPPGAASPERIYHPESVDPVRIKQLEREQEQARLHAYEDRANMPHSSAPASAQKATQPTRTQSTRSAQEAARRGKQTRRAQVAQQHAARAATYSRFPVSIGNDAHLNEIRQSAIDDAEKLRTAPPVFAEPTAEAVPETSSPKKESFTAGLPVAGAAQFAAMSNRPEKSEKSEDAVIPPVVIADIDAEEKGEDAAPAVIPVVIPASAVEVITPDSPIAEDVQEVAEEESDTAVVVAPAIEAESPEKSLEDAPEDTPEEALAEETVPDAEIAEEEIEKTEESAEEQEEPEIPVVIPVAIEEKSEEPDVSDVTEDDTVEEVSPAEEDTSPEAETAEVVSEAPAAEAVEDMIEDPAAEEEILPEEASEEAAKEETAEENLEETAEAESEVEEENESTESDEEEEDVKVYVPPEKNVESAEKTEETDNFDEEYYEYEDNDEIEEDVVTTPVVTSIPAPAKRRRNFETRISSELTDPSAYSPGVAQDETLFIRKKRPEEATAVFAATTPGLAPEFDDDDFFEQWLEEGDDMIIKDKRQRRRVSAIIGGATMIFAIIGFIFVVVWFINGIPNGSNTKGSQTDYAKFILPVVNADPEPFETITSVDNNILVEAAINRLTYGEAAADQTYTALEVENETRLLIPASDVEKSGRVLFGDTFAIDYTAMYAIEDEKIYYYSAADDCFHVITTGGDIEPEIIKISHIGSRTQALLEVGYISASEESLEGSDYYKMMEYVLNAKEDGTYYVSAIRAIEND